MRPGPSSDTVTGLVGLGLFALFIYCAGNVACSLYAKRNEPPDWQKPAPTLPATKVTPKPEMPIQVTFRRSSVANGLVAQFNNTSDRYLKIHVQLRNPTTREVNQAYLEVDARRE